MKLSTAMSRALAGAIERGGLLDRRPGGYWTKPDEPYIPASSKGPYDWWISTPTVRALVDRGLFEFERHAEVTRAGRLFWETARVTEQGKAHHENHK